MKILSEDPYLKFFISRICSKHCERFCSYQASVIRLPVATYFLSSLGSDDRTKAVKFIPNNIGSININHKDKGGIIRS